MSLLWIFFFFLATPCCYLMSCTSGWKCGGRGLGFVFGSSLSGWFLLHRKWCILCLPSCFDHIKVGLGAASRVTLMYRASSHFVFFLNKKVKKVKQCLNIPRTTALKNVLLWWTRIIQRNNIGNFKDVEQWIRSWLTWPETQDGNRCWTVNTDTRDRFTKPQVRKHLHMMLGQDMLLARL